MENKLECESKKMTDKAFLQGFIISIVSIVLCLAALCSMTFAWFNASTESPSNLIESGRFGLDIKIYYLDEANNQAIPVTVTEAANGSKSCVLERAGKYAVYLYMEDDVTLDKGYCGVSINGKPELITESISTNSELGVIPPLTFTVETVEENVSVTFTPKWGLPANYNIVKDSTVTVEPKSPNESGSTESEG